MTKPDKPIADNVVDLEFDKPAQAPYAAPHQAPFVFFDHVSAYGILEGVAQLTLEARQMRCEDGSTVVYERSIIAHLRCALPTLALLRSSIDGVFKLAEQQAAAATANAAAEARRLN